LELFCTLAASRRLKEPGHDGAGQPGLAVRAERSAPLLTQIKLRFEETLGKISRKCTLAKAIRYSLSRWDALMRYTTDGRLDICNNAAERAIRPLALGRRNWTFAGSDSGGDRAATIYTIIETAKINGLDPEAYLRYSHRPHRRSPGQAHRRTPLERQALIPWFSRTLT